MHVLSLAKVNQPKFFEVLSLFGELWGPLKKGGSFAYQRMENPEILSAWDSFSYTRTLLSVKKFLMPTEFNMLDFTPRKYNRSAQEIPSRVLLGVHSCDIQAVNILDEFYAHEYQDGFYQERRAKTILIGSSCQPDRYCFCNKTNTQVAEKGFDLFLTDLGDYYLVWVGSSAGEDIVREGHSIFTDNITGEMVDRFINWRRKEESAFTNDIDMIGVTDLMELKYNDNKLWDYFGEKCLACGQCTMVCPTCTCFNVIDDLELNREAGSRRRYWDSCTFREYSMVAGGHNFRKNRYERLKLWYTHKLKAFIGHYGSPSCVGCGRCLVTCPVEINVYTVVAKLQGAEAPTMAKFKAQEVRK